MFCLAVPQMASAAEYDITQPGTWYRMLNLPSNIVAASLAFTACSYVVICWIVEGAARSAICLVVCILFIGVLDPQTILDPMTRYGQNMTKFWYATDNAIRIWVLAHVMAIVFATMLAIALVRTLVMKKQKIPI